MTIDQQLKNRIVNCQSCEKQDEVAVPQAGRNVVPNAFVLAWLTLVLVLDAENIFLEIESAERKPGDADKNEKYVSHALNIVIRIYERHPGGNFATSIILEAVILDRQGGDPYSFKLFL